MKNEPRWRRYLRFHRADPQADIDDELRDHLESTTEALVATGASADDARAEALRRLGDVNRVRTTVANADAIDARTSSRTVWLESAWNDVVFAWRQLRRAPTFTAVAAASIALGVGLNVTIFSLANGLLLRPLPGARTDGLQRVYVNHHSGFEWRDFSWLRDHATLLQSMTGEQITAVSMETGDAPERIVASFATRGFFQTLGVRMAVGRPFDVDERQTGEAVTVLSYATWQSRFGGDSSIVGRSIRLAGHPFTVVGVAAPEFTSSVFGWSPALWIPLASVQAITGTPVDRFSGTIYTIARLRDAGNPTAAGAQLAALARQIYAMDTTRFREYTIRLDHVRGVNAELRAPAAVATGFLLAMVGLVLLIACANVASLLLGRATARHVEIGVRLALGASQGRLVRQLFTESLMLALIGAAGGIGVAVAAIKGAVRLLPTDLGLFVDFSPDRQVFAFAVLTCIASAVLFGLLPALRATSPSLTGMLRGGDETVRGRRARTRGVLVGGQVALSVVLLAMASLLSQSFLRSRAVNPGFVAAGVLDAQFDVGARRDTVDAYALYDRLTQRIAMLPGVESVALAEIPPLAGSNMATQVALDGAVANEPASRLQTYFNVVGAGYFATLKLPMTRGREFTNSDAQGSPMVVVINETAARRWWPGGDALGKRFRWGGTTGQVLEVVGIARDAKYNTYGEDPTSFVYLPLKQHYRSQMLAHVRAAPNVTPATLRAAVRATDATLAPPATKPFSDEIALALLPARLGALLLGAFGGIALLIAGSGIYGVTSYAVSRRAREIGIRSALGASRGGLLRMIIGEGMRTVAAGAAAGVVIAVAIGAALARVLYGVSAIDPVMLVGVPAVLGLVALVACWVPARRAARIDPVTAMRSE